MHFFKWSYKEGLNKYQKHCGNNFSKSTCISLNCYVNDMESGKSTSVTNFTVG